MSITVVPEWMSELEEEDVAFIRRFLLASGSLKEVAKEYRLIQKIQLADDRAADPYVALIKRLAVNDKIDFEAAKLLIQAYRNQKEGTPS